jgi:hypothetical protein
MGYVTQWWTEAWANEEADVCDMHTHLNAAVVHHLQRFNKP